MRVLVLEDNLMWSPRLSNGLKTLGHEPIVVARPPAEWPAAEAAIVNLGVPAFVAAVPVLEARGTRCIGHAGHKEKELIAYGRDAGCTLLVTNSELTHKLGEILGRL